MLANIFKQRHIGLQRAVIWIASQADTLIQTSLLKDSRITWSLFFSFRQKKKKKSFVYYSLMSRSNHC